MQRLEEDDDSKLFVMIPDPHKKGSWKLALRKEPTALGQPCSQTSSGSSKHMSQVEERHVWGAVLLPSVPRLRTMEVGCSRVVPQPPPQVPALGLGGGGGGGGGSHGVAIGASTSRPTSLVQNSILAESVPSGSPSKKKLDPLTARVSGKTGTGRISKKLLDGGASQREHEAQEKTQAQVQLTDFDRKLETKFALVSGMSNQIEVDGVHRGPTTTTVVSGSRSLAGGSERESTRSRTKPSARFLPPNIASGGTLAPLNPMGSEGGAPGNHRQGRRQSMLQEGKIRAPIFGLLAGIQPYELRAAFDRLAQLNGAGGPALVNTTNLSYGRTGLANGQQPSILTIGLSTQDFQDLLSIVVPQMPLSTGYVERLMESFDTTINNGTRRLSLVNLISQFGEGACPEVEKNLRIFWAAFENSEISQLLLTSLTRKAVRDYALVTKECKGKPLQNWLAVAKALNLDPRLSSVHKFAAAKLASIERRKVKEKKMRKPVVFTRRFVNLQADRDLFGIFLDANSGSGDRDPLGEEASGGSPTGSPTFRADQSVELGASGTGLGEATGSAFKQSSFSTHGTGTGTGGHGANDGTEPTYCVDVQQLRVLVYGSEQLFHAFRQSLWIPPKLIATSTTAPPGFHPSSPGSPGNGGGGDESGSDTEDVPLELAKTPKRKKKH